MRLRIDLDDTVVDLAPEWIRQYNDEWDDDLRIDGVRSWSWHTHVKPECGWAIYDILNRPDFFLNLKPVEGAVEGLLNLWEKGHEIVFVSAIPEAAPNSYGQKIEWLKHHVPFFVKKNFIAADRKELVGGDLLFDDGAHNLRGYLGISVGMNRPWNSDLSHVASADAWMDDWTGFEQFVHRISTDDKSFATMKDFAETRLWRYNK